MADIGSHKRSIDSLGDMEEFLRQRSQAKWLNDWIDYKIFPLASS